MSSDSGSSISAGEDQQQLAIDQRQHVLQAEQEGTQKRTFSNWINSQLSKHQKASVVKDLFTDVHDGHILLDLLEVLSEEVLPREKGKNVFQSRTNIELALTFLRKRSIKLINIHVEDIISGKPSIVLGLIWQIILHFHIEGLASILAATDDQPEVVCETKNGVSPTASPSPKRSAKSRWKISAKKVLLLWAQERCAQMGSINVTDFKSSWKNGMAFLAIIHSLRPDLIDMEKLREKSNEEKLQEAFRIAEDELQIPRLIEPEDLNVSDPDEKSIMTYVAQFLQHSKNVAEPTRDMSHQVNKTIEWLNLEEQTLKKLFSEMKDETYTKKYQEILLFMRRFNEQKRIFLSNLAVESLQAEEQRLIKQSFENITFQIAEWKEQLDRSLPPPLDIIENWLSEVENLMSQELPKSGTHYNTMSLLQSQSLAFKALMVNAASHLESLKSFKNIDDNGVVIVPTDKTDEMKTRLEKIMAANFSVLLDYNCSRHCVLALLEEGQPKLKSWKIKYKSQESLETLLADYKEFVEDRQFMVHLETAFQKFEELHKQLLTTDGYSDDPELNQSKQYEVIELKCKTFVGSAHDTKSTLEKVLTCWTQFENNIILITAWLDEQQRIPLGNVPMEILSKWKSVHKSLNRDGNFLIERTNQKTASKLSHRLNSFNNRWTKYVKQYEEQKAVGNGSKAQEELYDDTKEECSMKPLDVSAHFLRMYIQNLQKIGEEAGAVQVCSQILSHLETFEKLNESVDSWSGGAEQILSCFEQQRDVQEPLTADVQDFYDNGISCQEQLAKSEINLQAATQLILSHKDLQCFDADGLKRNVVRARERVQDLVSRLGFVLHPPEQYLPEKDIERNFERSKSDLETYITSALNLLGQKVTPEELISQYEKTVSKYDSQSLEKFLKAADQMKNISSSAKEKMAVDEVSNNLRFRWKLVHDELESYLCQLKIHIEKKRFDDLFSKLEKQILKENRSMAAENVEELVREHEVVFSENGCLGELNQCVQAMKTLNDWPSTGADSSKVATLISECTKKKEDLEKKAADIYLNLLSHRDRKNKISMKDVAMSENGMKSDICKLNGSLSSQEVSETGSMNQNGGNYIRDDNEAILQTMLKRYDVMKTNLELLIQKSREKLVAESPKEAQALKELHNRIQELQVLQTQANQSWSEFEAMSQKLALLLHGIEKKTLSEERSALQSDLETITEEINIRIQSLSVTINVLLPIEQEVSFLCESSRQASVQEMEQFTISNIDFVYDKLKKFQSSVEDHIQQCDNLEFPTEIVDPSSPVDVQTVQSIVYQYKTQLEATNETMKEREALLKDLETFLSSLEATKLSIQAEVAVLGMDRSTVLEKQKNLKELENKVYRLKQEAEKLDESLEPFEIYLEDPDHGGETSCQKMIDVFFEKIEIAKQAVLQQLRSLEDREASGIQSLNGTVHDPLQTEDNYMVSRINQQPHDREMERFTVSNIDLFVQKIKDVQSTFETEIQQCDNLDPSATLNQYKMELKTTNEVMKERETTLKSLGTFVSFLKAAKMSINAESLVLCTDRLTLQEKQRNLESLEKDIYSLGQEAEKLDDSLKAAKIILEDPEYGETSCQKMISEFFEKLESAQQGVLKDLRELEEKKALETLNRRQKNLCKYIEDIQDQIDKIGLKDPSIHAVQQRMESLTKLEKKLESVVQEKTSITEAFPDLLQTSQGKDFSGWEECKNVMEDTRQYITNSKEQCEEVIELLRKFQHHKTGVTSLIQKAETTISHQSSYKGKENLHKMTMKVQALKQEIDNHSKNVEEINSICKKLQFQINKIKSFENPPFQEEANMIIDKWLDICEKLDRYNENLASAIGLWNKILSLSEEIEQWSELKIKSFENTVLTSDDVQLLNTELQNQEKRLEEISKKSREIQKLLQSDEPPLELQVIKTSLLNKLTPISKFVSNKAESVAISQKTTEFGSPDAYSVVDGIVQMRALPPGDVSEQHGNGEPPAQTKEENFATEEDSKAQPDDRQQYPTPLMVETHRLEFQAEPQRDEQSERLEALKWRLTQLKTSQEHLHIDLLPGLQDKVKQLESCTHVLQECQDLTRSLEELKSPASDVSPGLHNNQWLEIKQFHESLIWELQDTMQVLESRIDGHQRYESLSAALNNKMISFYEELLNFAGSSRENAPCEQKRQKLQELCDQYEGLQGDLTQVSQLAEYVKQSTSSLGVKRIQEAVDMCHSKMKGYLERIDYLKSVIDLPPMTAKPKGKKTKKGSKKKLQHTVQPRLEPSLQPTLQLTETHSLQPTMTSLEQPTVMPLEQPTVTPLVQPTVTPLVQPTVTPLEQPTVTPLVQPTVTPLVQPTVTPLVQPTVTPLVQPTVTPLEQPTVIPLVHPTVTPLVQPTVTPLVQPTVTPLVQPTVTPLEQPTVTPLVQPTVTPLVQPTVTPLVQPTVTPLEQPTVTPLVQPTVKSLVQPTVTPLVQPTVTPLVQTMVTPLEQPTVTPLEQPTVTPLEQPTVTPLEQTTVTPLEQTMVTPLAQPTVTPLAQPTVTPLVQPTVTPLVQPTVTPLEQPTVTPLEQPTVTPLEQPTVTPLEQPTVTPLAQPTVTPRVKPTVTPRVKPNMMPLVQPTVTPLVQPTVTPLVQPRVMPLVQTGMQPSVQPAGKPSVETTVAPSIQSLMQPIEKHSMQHTEELSVQSAVQLSVQPAIETTVESSVQPLMQPIEKHSVQLTVEPSVLPAEQPSVLPAVKPSLPPAVKPLLPPAVKPSVPSAVKPSVPPAVKPSVSLAVKPSVPSAVKPSVPPAVKPSVLPAVKPLVSPAVKPSVPSVVEPSVQSAVEPSVPPAVEPSVPPAVEPSVLPAEEPSVPSVVEPSVPSAEEPSVPSAEEPSVLSAVEPSVQPLAQYAVELAEQSISESSVQKAEKHMVEPSVQPAVEPSVQPAVHPSMVPTVEFSVQLLVQSTEKHSMHHTVETSVSPLVQPGVEPLLQLAVKPLVQPVVEPLVQRVTEPLVQPAVEPLVQPAVEPTEEPSVQHPVELTVISRAESSIHPSMQATEKRSVQYGLGLSVQHTVEHSTKPSAQPALSPSVVPPVHDAVKQAVDDAVKQALDDAVKQAVDDAVKQAVQDAVELAVQDEVQPAVEMSLHPIVQRSEKPSVLNAVEPLAHPAVQHRDTGNVKEKKGSKSRKKKKSVAGANAATKQAMENQAVNKAVSSVQNLDTMNHSEESLNTEIGQKKHYLDVMDSWRETVEEKALAESAEVKREQQEASGQLQTPLHDRNSSRRQMESSLNDLTACTNDSLPISGLLTTVQEKLREAEKLPDDGEKVVILNEAQDVQLVSDEDKETSSEAVSALQPVSLETEDEMSKELKLLFAPYQLQEIFSDISHIGGKQTWTEKPLEKFARNIKLLYVGEDDKKSLGGKHRAVVKRNINDFRKQPFKLNVMELDQQIQDIKKVYNDISQLESQESCFQKEEQDGDGQDSSENLLTELITLKTEKEKLRQQFENLQDALSAARLSYQMLAKEKENLKMASTESHISHLGKITHFLDKIAQEKETLNALKLEQANIGGCRISSKAKDEIDIDVRQLEEFWEQTELSVHREHDRLVKEDEELAFLKQKAHHVQRIIQIQQDLLDQPSSSPEDILKASLLLSADIEANRHLFSALRNACDLQIKRSLGASERRSLENSLDNLQRELESLEERVKDQQLTRCQTPNALLEQYSFLKPLYQSLLWINKSQNRVTFDQDIALLPEDIEWQITACKSVHKNISDRKATVDSVIQESKHISSGTDLAESRDFSSFFQQLQKLYQEQIMQSVERLQLLESGLEKRKALFSEIEKLKELLQCLEKEATPVIRGIFTATELCEQLNCLKAKTTEMEEIEGLVLTLLRNSQSYHGELKNSEQLYLDDVLRSLKSKARRIRRLEEKKFSYTEKLLRICNEFQDRTTSLGRELSALEPIEPEIHDEAAKRVGEGFENKLPVSQNAISSSQDHLSEVLSYKDLFEDNRLYWDGLTVDNLQNKCVSLTKHAERSGHFEHSGPAQGHYQELLERIKAMVCSVQREAAVIGTNFDIIDAQVLCKKMKKISILSTEALRLLHEKPCVDKDTLKNEQTIRAVAENVDRLHQSLSQLITNYHTKDKSIEYRLKQTLCHLMKIDRDLQGPFVVEMDSNKTEEQLLWLEALQEICKSEAHDIRSMSSQGSTEDIKEQRDKVESIGKQIETKLSQCIDTAKKTRNSLQHFQQVITNVTELFTQYEGKLQMDPVDLNNLETQGDFLISKQEEVNTAVAEIHHIANELKPICKPYDQEQLDAIVNQVTAKNCLLTEMLERKRLILASNQEKYHLFRSNKQKIIGELEEMEATIRDSFSQKPASYKAALGQWEKSKNLVTKIHSYEEELLKLKQASRDLTRGSDGDIWLVDKVMESLWDRWLYLLGICRDWELYCDELKQEWKLINELMEMEMILLDNCQEDALDTPEMKQKATQLLNSIAEIRRFEENVKMQQLQLSLLRCRIQNILGTPEINMEKYMVPVIQEIHSMKDKCEMLQQKAQTNKQEIRAELQERETLKDDVSAVKKSLLQVSCRLEDLKTTDPADTRASLEELQSSIDSGKEKAKLIMEKLRAQYAELIPVELLSPVEECQVYLQEMEEKVKNEIEQSSPQNIMTRKVNDIIAGLQSIEVRLTEKSQNIFQAKDLQKTIWDEVDVWHSKLHELESEVQDMAEEDPCQAQEWMDKLTEPFSHHQQVTCFVERRTTNLNKAASKLEEYEDIVKSTKSWIQNTDNLLNEEMKDCSAKVLNKHVTALEIALDDSEQKQHLLDIIHSELGDLSLIFETDSIVERLGEIRSQVRDLQQRILNVLPQIQHIADEVVYIENEVKKMEKRVDSMKTILTSSEIDDMSPREHYTNGHVILENIETIRKTIVQIEAYRPALALPESGVQSLCVFRRMGRLLREAEMLEKVTKEQTELLETIISEMSEVELEQEKLKHLSKNVTSETSEIKEKTEAVRKQLEGLNQKKEVVLLARRSSVTEQLERLQLEPHDQDLEAILSPVTEGVNLVSNELKRMDSYFLPSLAEEAEESTLTAEAVDEETVDSEGFGLVESEGEKDVPASAVTSEEESQEQLGDAGKTLADVKPEMILTHCQWKVTEVELWLQRVNLSSAESTQDPDMLQNLEEQLADCQNILQETENKINSLLEDTNYRNQGNGTVLEEAESLSLKLKALKISLEHVQVMLQLHNGVKVEKLLHPSLFRAADSVDKTDVISTEITNKKYPAEMLPMEELCIESQSRSAVGDTASTPTKPWGKTPLSVLDDITWSKWQYLQKELSYRTKATSLKHTNEPEVAKEVKISFLSRLPVSTVKSPLTEESKHFLTRLRALNEEAAAPLTQESARNLHGSLFVWLCSVSQWLQNVEETLDTDVLSREEAAPELVLCEKLTDDLHTLSEEMGYKTGTLLQPITHEGEKTGVLSQCYSDIRDWLIQTQMTAKSRYKHVQVELEKHHNYQNDIRQLYDVLAKKKTDVLQCLSNRSMCEAAELLQEAAAYETELQSFESQVSSLNERGDKLSIPICSNQEINKLEDVLDDTWRILRTKQDQCSSAVVSKSKMDALLCGVSELMSFGKEKIHRSKEYHCRSKENLNSHIHNHKKFFSILDSQVLLLETLSSKNSKLDVGKEGAETVVLEANLLREEAEAHCIYMMGVMKDWNEFDSRYDCLSKKLEALKSMVPTNSLVEESEERVMERLNQYKKIKKRIDENESRLCQIIVSGKRLQSAVSCPELDTHINMMEQQWSELTKNVNHELHRLESLVSHLASYNKDSAELSVWLESAHQKLNNYRMQSLDATQNLDTIKNNLVKFFEFTNDVDQKSSLKTSVVNTGTQLLRLKEADTAVVKLSLAKFEDRWTELIAALPPIQEKLHQLLMEKLPSLEAIQELMDWMKGDEHVIELQSVKSVPSTVADIRGLLQRYKIFRKQMSHKQWIIDFVNQSLPQLSVGDVESNRYEKTEFAELLGTLNLHWNQMQGDLKRKIQHLEQTRESISDQESRRQTLSNWFDAQQLRLSKLHWPSSIRAAESVLVECTELEEQVKSKSTVIEELEASRVATVDQSVSNEGVLTSETLFKKRDRVAKQVAELKTSMQSVLRHWKAYSENYEHVERMIVKLLYVLDQSRIPSSSLNCLKHNLKRLQAVQEEVEQREENWSNLRASLNSLEALCSPTVLTILEEESRDSRNRWTATSEELSGHLRSGGIVLQLWQDYTGSCEEIRTHTRQVEDKCEQLLCARLSEDRVSNTLQQRIQDLHVLEQSLQGVRAHNLQVSELADKVTRQNPTAADVIQSERQNTSHRIAHLESSVSSKAAEMTSIQSEVESFKSDLEKFQSYVKSSADVVGHVCLSKKEKEDKSEVIKKHLLELSELNSDVERLNEEIFTLPLDDRTQMSLQNLNRMWAKTVATALEDCREHRMIELEKNNFIQNYETWMQSLEKMENSLTVGIAGTFETLKKQQEIYERLQAEIAINEHILPSFVNKALSVLELEEEENRNKLILKLTSLKEKWQSVIRLVQQRKREINVLLKQWWQFKVSKQRLGKYLLGIQDAVSSVSRQKCHGLINVEKLLYDFKDKEQHLKRLHPSYFTTVNNCKDLLSVAEPECKEVLQRDLTELQHQWQSTALQLQTILTHFNDIAQKRENFEWKVEDRRKTLDTLKVRVDEPLPTRHEELQRAKEPIKELQEALDEWGDSLKDLDNMKTELSQYIIAEDGLVLKRQVEALHSQWEELCLRVSMRKQEIEDRLNAWNVFNDKNKELCDWLTQMEGKVLQTADVNIEEMIEKLQKDCMEEINLFSENKLHLKQIGDQLIIASNKARSTEIENKLNKVNDRWKHLFDVIGSRVKKLKETLLIIQQLYKNMSNLRTWLARIESELSKPVVYSICDDQEINNKLEEQRDLQKDIELHSSGVVSVLTICERLLHDTDACANETECDSIQQTTRSLDKRWRNICAMSMERRVRIEETWRLWQKFLEDYSRFDEWLKDAETMAAFPDSSDVLYTKAKEEQKKFEAFQRQIHERLTHLELINKQYRRLARENRTDAASKLKQMVHEGNQRWDQLQKRVASVLRRLKHFTSQREDFEGTRDSILVWLTEMDLQLTNVEHFSESDIEEKMQQLIGFKKEITLNTNKIDQLIVFGEQLIQKSEAMDAVVIEDELEEIHRYCQEVFGRVYRFHERLTSRDLRLEEERETSENDTDGEDSREIQNSSWHATIPDVDTSHQSLCHLMPPTLPHERSGRETPVSVDSIPLEWDPTVDVGGSSMNENEEEGAYYNSLSDVEIPENPEAYVIMTTKTVQASSGKSDLETPSWHSPERHIVTVKSEYKDNEMVKGLMSAMTGTTTSFNLPSSAQMYTSSPTVEKDARTSSSTIEQLEDKGLRGMDNPETHSGVIERWEIIQAQSLSSELRVKQNLQQWQQLNADLDNITLWLDKTDADLDSARKLKLTSTIQELEHKVKRLKDTLKAFDHYKALVISANLSSKAFQQVDEPECWNVLSRLHIVNSRWDKACRERDERMESLQSDLLQCEEFHERSHQLLLWLTEAEDRRLRYQVMDHNGDPHALLESQKQLMRLEEQLAERQVQVNSLQDLSSYLLGSTAGAGYIEAEERTHVIGTKMKQLMKDVSQDLNTVQQALDNSTTDEVDSLSSAPTHTQAEVGKASIASARTKEQPEAVKEVKRRSFFCRVLRAALPLQIVLLLLLLFACMIPFSEEDYSCAQSNNFARSFYPMLRYTNGPPPT